MIARVGEILIIEDMELFVRIFDKPEGVALGAANSEVNGAGAFGLVDGLKRSFHIL